MISGNTSDFIGHPYRKILYPHMRPPTMPGPRTPVEGNNMLKCWNTRTL